MTDLSGKKADYRSYRENFYTSDKEDVSERKLTQNDEPESSVMDLQTILHRDPNSPAKIGLPKLMPVRSSSWESSTLQSIQNPLALQKSHSSGNHPNEIEDIKIPDQMTMSAAPTRGFNEFSLGKTNLTVNQPVSILTSPDRKYYNPDFVVEQAGSVDSPSKKKNGIEAISVSSSGQLNLRDKVRFMTEDDLVNSGDRDYHSRTEQPSGKNSPFNKLLVPNNEKGSSIPSSALAKFKRPSKTVVFDKYDAHSDVNPDDIGLAIENKMFSGPKPTAAQASLDNSMKEEQGGRLRYDIDFFQKHIVNRTGVPTITAKKRDNARVMNLYNFDNNPVDSDPRQELNGLNPSIERSKTMNISLLKELASIEKQKQIKMKMEQFVLVFNKDAWQGINYLISSNLIEDTPEKIAQCLLVTEGLNKEQIGAYLGSYKEKNKIILKAYCQLLDFRNLEFDQALRLLLSRFKLPGEAQQIERIVNVFATVYHSDNPQVFLNEDTPFILAYSLLMLNTDAHSEMVQSKNKMTRQQFIENNVRVCNLSRDYLGRMYDNITKRKFETKADYIETIYNRLHQGNLNIQGESLKGLFDLAKVLMEGAKFIKYGRKGKSHERKVWISEKEDAILWTSLPAKNDKPRSLPFSEIRDVLLGHNSTEVLIKNKVPSEFDSVVLSIVAKGRTLDLRAPDVNTRVKWERYFRLYLLQRKDKSKGVIMGGREQRKQKEKDHLSEIWKVDILPTWESHWDYENRKPKNMGLVLSQPKRNNRNSIVPRKNTVKQSSSFWNIFRKKKKTTKKNDKRALRKSSENEVEEIKIEENAEEEEEDEIDIQLESKDKSLLLVTLWKRGIPDWLRSILWPIAISNQLEITQNLYEILCSQAQIFLKGSALANSLIADSLRVMQLDLEESLEAFPMIDDDKKVALVNILEAFIFYRPDVGYVKGMCRLVMILLLYCTEYRAFLCFINLTHSHHFISFFRGIMREIEWRIRFFNKIFAQELPHLFDHFKALDLSSEMFILEWFLSLFSMAISDVDIISRIWDCFLLEGEVYAIKTGVAILKYFELELKMTTFDGAIKFLKGLPKEIDEDLLFGYIERVDVSIKEYQDELGAQKVAEINSKVHQALLEN